MKILLLNDDFPPQGQGGAASVTYRLAKEFQQLGHQVLVITTVRDKKDASKGNFNNLEIIRIQSEYPIRFRSYVSLNNHKVVSVVKKIISDFDPDVVNFHNVHHYLSYASLKAAKKLGKPVFLTLHDVMPFSYGKLFPKIADSKTDYRVTFLDSLRRAKLRFNPFRNLVIRRYLKYPDKIFSVSQELKKVLELHKIKNIEVIHNGVDPEDIIVESDAVNSFKNKFKLEGKKVVLFAGRLSAAKGGKNILEVIAKVKKNIPNVSLLVAGPKEGFAQVMISLAKGLGIHDSLIVTGWLDEREISLAYASSDVCVIPSICFDSFPTVALEAMANKLPVIASCYGGAKELIQDKDSGYIINPNDINLLAEEITLLLNNKELARKMREKGHQILKDNFSLTKQTERYLFWYNKYIE